MSLAAQATIKQKMLQLKSAVKQLHPVSPLVFFCQISLSTGKSKDRYVESLAALGIGVCLNTTHRLFNTSDDDDSNGSSGGEGGGSNGGGGGDGGGGSNGSSGSSGGSGSSGSSSSDYSAPDVEGLVRVAVVASDVTETNTSAGTEDLPSDISNFEFSAQILSFTVASFLTRQQFAEPVHPHVCWIALAAVANLFSIFEVRKCLLGDTSLQVLPSLTRLLSASSCYIHGSGQAHVCSQLEVVKALCTATKTPSGLLLWLKFENEALLFQDSSGLCIPSPKSTGRPIHILTDTDHVQLDLEHLWQKQSKR